MNIQNCSNICIYCSMLTIIIIIWICMFSLSYCLGKINKINNKEKEKLLEEFI